MTHDRLADDRCGLCPPHGFERNHYFHDKRMTVRDFRDEQRYHDEKRRLLNRAVHGCGVVCGLKVELVEPEVRGQKLHVRIEPGVALDGCGREVVVCDKETRCVRVPDEPAPCEGEVDGRRERKLHLCLTFHDQPAEPVIASDDGCGASEVAQHNRIREGWCLRLIDARDAKECTCKAPCPLDAMQHGGCGDSGSVQSVRDYLCHERSKGCPVCCDDECVVLGTVRLVAWTPDAQTPPAQQTKPGQQTKPTKDCPEPPPPEWIAHIDPCADRKLVYTNPLLFDLVQCYHGDLPRITEVSWRTWHVQSATPTRNEFVSALKKGLEVCFDRDMDARTLSIHTFRVQVFTFDGDSNYYRPRNVPGTVELIDPRKARFVAFKRWTSSEFGKSMTEFSADTFVEIRLIGSLIFDKAHKKGLDGAALQFPDRPTGSGVQGTDFVSCFTVKGTGHTQVRDHDEEEEGDLQ